MSMRLSCSGWGDVGEIYEDESDGRSAANLLTKNEARASAVNVAKLPELLRGVA